MGRDVPDGRMSLAGDRLQVDWRKDTEPRRTTSTRPRRSPSELADELGGHFLDNPLWLPEPRDHGARARRLSDGPEQDAEGVVDACGQVFNHPGLHVADGSVMPGPVGPNPSLTIAALADRFADAMIDGAPDTRAAGARRRAPRSRRAGGRTDPGPRIGAISLRLHRGDEGLLQTSTRTTSTAAIAPDASSAGS